MANRFQLKKLFTDKDFTILVQNFGFKRMPEEEISYAIHTAFSDYIVCALSELNGSDENNKHIYIEAAFHLGKAEKLLASMPHPAGKMSYRMSGMIDTLNKLIEGRINLGAERAGRFMEKNLVRKLKSIWTGNTATPFHPYGDGSGKNPRDFLLECFAAAHQQYPEIQWFADADPNVIDTLIKSIKR